MFCISCGEPLDGCLECDAARGRGDRFCPRCGRPLTPPEPRRARFGLSSVVMLIAPVVAAMLVIQLVLMLAGAGGVWGWAADMAMSILVLKPELDVIGAISGLGLQLFWVFLVVAITASVLLVFYQTWKEVKDAPDRGEAFGRTPMFWMCMLLCASLLLNVILAIPQLGSTTSLPDDTVAGWVPEALLTYANAAVWEEIITRVAFMGVPMTVLALCQFRKDFWRCLFGGFGVSRLGLVLMVVSAVVFGFGHLSGWGLWKVLPTMITGLALGYLYMRFGVHVSITFHFAVDYMAVMLDGALSLVVSVALILILVAGIPCIVEVARRIGNPIPKISSMPALLPDQESSFRRRD